MAAEEIKHLKLKRGSAGVFGLPELLEQARSQSFFNDEELKDFLLRGIKPRNYVAPGAEEEYREALFREYKKFVGEPLPEEPGGLIEIRILGPGCPRCRALEEATMAALAELNAAADLQHVSDLREMSHYGIIATPGLVINGTVKSAGRVLSKEQVKALLSAELGRLGTR